MKTPRLSHARTASVAEALALLAEHEDEARVLAGGQSLVPMLNFRLAAPKVLVDINRIEALSGIEVAKNHVRIGALARHAELERSADVAKHLPLVAAAVPHIAHPAIRNRGTFGGSCALADPAAELPACALALGATFIAAGKKGERRIAARDFFKGLYATALKAGELLVAAEFPLAKPGYASAFGELARRHGDYAMVGVAAHGSRKGGKFSDMRVAFFGVGDRPQRASGFEKALEGQSTVDGERVKRSVAARTNLADFLRNELELTGTHVGCEHGVCGACTVRVDGEIVRSCLMFAAQADGCTVDTIEGLSDSREIEELQSAFVLYNALQCGFCTPGVLMAAQSLLRDESNPSRERIREYLSGNYCRCTGYQAIVDAIEAVAEARAGRSGR